MNPATGLLQLPWEVMSQGHVMGNFRALFIYNNVNETNIVFSTFFKVNYLIVDVHLRTEVGSYSGFTWDCYTRRAKDQEIHGMLYSF